MAANQTVNHLTMPSEALYFSLGLTLCWTSSGAGAEGESSDVGPQSGWPGEVFLELHSCCTRDQEVRIPGRDGADLVSLSKTLWCEQSEL